MVFGMCIRKDKVSLLSEFVLSFFLFLAKMTFFTASTQTQSQHQPSKQTGVQNEKDFLI